MTSTDVIRSVLGVDNFVDYEQEVYKKYQEMAERKIVEKLNSLLLNTLFLQLLQTWGRKCACRFIGYKVILIRLMSGQQWEVQSPVFRKAKPKRRKGGRPLKRQKGTIRHLGLELLGIINQSSPALSEICVTMAVLCPSFEVAATALRNFGIEMNQHLLQNVTKRFAILAMGVRIECHAEEVWQKPGLRILICVDGGRIRERRKKRGKRKAGQKRQGYHSDWIEPRQLTISQFDENGKKIKSISPILDGSCGSLDDFFGLLKDHLLYINLDEAAEIVFCADGGTGIWPRVDNLIDELALNNARRILDYTHAKQNISEVRGIISKALKLTARKIKKLFVQIRDLLWNGDIQGIADLAKEMLKGKRKAPKAVSKKLTNYFGDHTKFQYKKFRDNGLPTGSGTVESAIRRVINLRVKGSGMFWKKENAEKIIFLRSLVLTGKIKNACRKATSIVKKMFDNNELKDMPMPS